MVESSQAVAELVLRTAGSRLFAAPSEREEGQSRREVGIFRVLAEAAVHLVAEPGEDKRERSGAGVVEHLVKAEHYLQFYAGVHKSCFSLIIVALLS